jgi:ATP-dependent protease ClpP protease subunit
MNEGHIFIDGPIDGYMYEYFKEQLEANRTAPKLILHLTSPGGSVNYGYNIYHKLRSLSIPKECVIEGNCMSIATFIALACDKIIALNPSRYMIHLPSNEVGGTREDLENGARELGQIEQEMIEAYGRKTKLPPDQIMDMLKKTTYLTAQEAKKFGFVDEVKEELKAVAFGKSEPKMTKVKDASIFDDFSKRIAQAFKDLFNDGPKAIDMPLKQGGMITISEDGKMATIEGNPCPAGTYETSDGKTVVVQEGGMVQEIKPAAAPPAPAQQLTPEQQRIQALETENAALKAKMAEAEQAKATAEQAANEAKAKSESTAKAFGELKNDFEDLKKKTLGDDTPPAGPKAHEKKPAGDPPAVPDWQVQMLEEIKERTGLHYHLNNKK